MCSMNWSKRSQAPWPIRKQRALGKAATEAQKRLETRCKANCRARAVSLQKHGPGRPPKDTASLEQLAQEADVARQEHQRMSAQREQVAQSIRTIGHAYHCVDVERGVRRNGKLIAADIQEQIDTVRTVAQHEGLSQTCLERIEKAETARASQNAGRDDRVCLGDGAATACPSHSDTAGVLRPTRAHPIPSFYLERVARTRSVYAGKPLREVAEWSRSRLGESPAAASAWPSEAEQGRAATIGQRVSRGVHTGPAPMSTRKNDLSLRHHQLRGLGPSQETGMSYGDSQLLPRAGRRDDCGGAVLRAEASVDVCCDPGIR